MRGNGTENPGLDEEDTGWRMQVWGYLGGIQGLLDRGRERTKPPWAEERREARRTAGQGIQEEADMDVEGYRSPGFTRGDLCPCL